MKMNGEGCETLLLDDSVKSLPPCVIDSHSSETTRRLTEKFGMKILKLNPEGQFYRKYAALLTYP